VRGDATLAGNAVTKSLRAGPREELIRRNNVNTTEKRSIIGDRRPPKSGCRC